MSKRVLFVGSQWPIHLKYVNFRDVCYEVHTEVKVPKKEVCDIDFVVPMMESDMQASTELQNVCMPQLANMKMFQDKQLFWKYVTVFKLEACVPRHFLQQTDTNEVLVIVKRPVGVSGVGHRILDLKQVTTPMFERHVVEEYLPGRFEYVAHIVADQGIVTFCVIYEYNFEQDQYIKGGVNETTILDKKVVMKEDIVFFEQFLLPCKYTGQCNFNYKIDMRDAKKKVLEINPRFGGSLMCVKNAVDLTCCLQALMQIYTKSTVNREGWISS